jgi:hypothetical protein
MEVWWIGQDSSVQDAYWYETPQLDVETQRDQTGGYITISGTGFTPNAEVVFYVDGLVGQTGPFHIGSTNTYGDGTLDTFGYEASIWSVYQTGPATVHAVDQATGQEATGQTWAFSY